MARLAASKFGVVQAIGDIGKRRSLHRQRHRPDDVPRRIEFSPDAGHPAQSVEIVPGRLRRRSRRRAPTTVCLVQPFLPGCSVCSRPIGPQLTNAPANFAEFKAVRDAALVSTWARSSTLKTKAIKKKVSRLSPPRLRRLRSVRRIARPRQSLHKGGRKPSPHLVGEMVTGTKLRCLKSAHTGQSGCAERE